MSRHIKTLIATLLIHLPVWLITFRFSEELDLQSITDGQLSGQVMLYVLPFLGVYYVLNVFMRGFQLIHASLDGSDLSELVGAKLAEEHDLVFQSRDVLKLYRGLAKCVPTIYLAYGVAWLVGSIGTSGFLFFFVWLIVVSLSRRLGNRIATSDCLIEYRSSSAPSTAVTAMAMAGAMAATSGRRIGFSSFYPPIPRQILPKCACAS